MDEANDFTLISDTPVTEAPKKRRGRPPQNAAAKAAAETAQQEVESSPVQSAPPAPVAEPAVDPPAAPQIQSEQTPAAPQADVAPAPAPEAPAGPTTQDLMAAIQGLTAAMQSANRNMAQMPDQHQMNGEDVLAQIIRPPRMNQ